MHAQQLAQQMIAIDSVSSKSNASIATLMRGWLEQLGFEIEQLEFVDNNGQRKVSFVAKRGPGVGGIAYFCHNDVVPTDGWNAAAGGPFSGAIDQGRLWGRGACDMKGSAAAALAAIARLPSGESQLAPIYFVVTSDEEHGMDGAQLIASESRLYREMVEGKCVGIIGEPTELQVVHAHKGTCQMRIVSRGVAAHSSTADGINANWPLIDFLQYLKHVKQRCEADGKLRNSSFSPSTLSMNLILTNVPTTANITVGQATCHIFFRPMPDVPWEALADEIALTARTMGLQVESIQKRHPVYTPVDNPFVRAAIELTLSHDAPPTTATAPSMVASMAASTVAVEPATVSYATDGCCFTGIADLIVLGPGSIEQAHRSDEWIALEQLDRGVEVFQRFFQRYAYDAPSSQLNLAGAPLLHSSNSTEQQSIEADSTTEKLGFQDISEHSVSGSSGSSSPATVQFRRATLADVASVNAMLRPFVQARKLLKRTRAEMESLVPSGFLAEADGRLIGFSAVEIYSRKLAEIQCLAVDSAYQGHGIGSELVRRCVELARERGVMEVLAISSSDSFLQKLGFNYSLPDQKRALFCQLRSRDEMFGSTDED